MTTGESISRAACQNAPLGLANAHEHELVLRAKQRLPDAWSQIYHEHYEKIFRYAYARLGHRETAEDLAATVFLEALKSIHGYRHGQRPLLAWLYTIARNVVNQHHRKRFRRGPKDALLGSDAHALAGQAPDSSAIAERIDLMSAILRLPEKQREVVLLHYFVGLTVPEVARILGKHERAVYSLHTRALKGIRRHLDGADSKILPASAE